MKELLTQFHKSKLSKLHLYTHSSNIKAKIFYEKHGFKEISLTTDNSGEKRIEMILKNNIL
jgi:ribosomal protein S18 acetylase RimI-like enzyme